MCQFQHLYCDVYGYVIRCSECRHYQLAFNCTVLSLTESEFQRFLAVAESHKDDQNLGEELKQIILPTPCKGVYMILSGDQLVHLSTMLETADVERKALSLLQLFQ